MHDTLRHAAETVAVGAGGFVALQMNSSEAALAVTIVLTGAAIIYRFSRVESGQRALGRAVQRVDRRTARLEKHVFGLDPVNDESDVDGELPA